MSGVDMQPAGAEASEPAPGMRGRVKNVLARIPSRPGSARGATLLIYHRLGGGTRDELDLPAEIFARQLDLLAGHDVVSLDSALDRLDAGDDRHSVVLTFDDGFSDVYDVAWPLLRDRRLPFTVYLASAYVDGVMRWEGATAKGAPGHGLSWRQLDEMVGSGLCTLANHTHNHVRPEHLTADELDLCNDAIHAHLGVTPRHFTYPWGIGVPALEAELRRRFRSVSTGELGRNLPGQDPMRLRRVPVRRTDPDAFFSAKVTGGLTPERVYALIVRLAKTARVGS